MIQHNELMPFITLSPLASSKYRMFYLSGDGLPRLSRERGH